ncbi:succinate dehydrogenase, cytochrome b556 subunit [Sphingosinicella rhizophila]|uniref:Succinate dehydrogenase cytochrome b556 subunit n=1 Tax=Sphingosinicella rhizophila TaxID=3050082 RepID=A0ABU3Q3F3_9SPHN|nr:succinate dehydrogenase, cytochrome b556 subunit [Sphingosinicella sp. GR2756]MDT9597929.1 succinate dehydrogenase, cytochrome b556 subunit [Sphingosinicella sp. GR2756]
MHRNPQRPLSPHLSVWRWGPHMLVSILHRITGSGLATIGALALIWWLTAAATGAEAYEYFVSWAISPYGIFVGIGLSWALFQHTLSGLRHFVMDIGAGFELTTNKFWANMTLVGSAVLTALLWAYIVMVK